LTKNESSSLWVFSVLKKGDVKGLFSITTNEKINKCVKNALIEKKETLSNVEQAPGPIWENLRVPVRFEFANIRFSQTEVASLYVGDVVVIDQIKSKLNREINVFIGENYVTSGSWVQDRIKLTKKLEIKMGMLEQQKKHLHYNKKEVSTEDLQIRLSFDAGSTNIDLKTLNKLRIGYTFKLDKNYENLINIRSEGDCIAVGELVEIGDSIGVRILEFAHGSN
jgi:type III secretion system YscQ/HrcQ family protein